ncbi:MAG TPA: ATP-binding protein [Kofleriaceae bacterium]|nr:ATP-binding protein [Kofleriaceae bacterium]
MDSAETGFPMTEAVRDVSHGVGLPPHTPRPHWVQFYETDNFLGDAVSAFFAEGMKAGEPGVIIATAPHREMFVDQMTARGINVQREIDAGRLVMLDAAETLGAFMGEAAPIREKFFATVGPVLDGLCRLASARQVRAFGEMVDILWRSGLRTAALELEELWNELRIRYDFALLCAYVMDSFYKQNGVPAICATHSHVLPPENVGAVSTALSANVQSLVHEIAKRTELEITLRESINNVRRSEEETRRAKEDLEDILENAPIPIHRVDRKGVIRWANNAELDLLGLARHEYVGHHISEFHADEDKIKDILRRLLAGEVLQDYEAPLRAKDGTIRWVQISSNMQQDNDRGTTRCFCRDVTAQKHAERDRDAIFRVTKMLGAELDLDRLLAKLISEVKRLTGAEKVCFLEGSRNDELAAMPSYLEVPLVAPSGELLGALALGHSQPAMFMEREENLLTAIASQAAGALSNARVYEAERSARANAERAERNVTLLQGVTSALSRAVSAEEACRVVVHETRAMLDASAACVVMLDRSGTKTERILVEGDYDDSHMSELQDQLLDSHRPAAEAARSGKLVWIVGATTIDARFPELREARASLGTLTWGAIPIVFEGRTHGAIGFRCMHERSLTPEEETLLLAVGRQCGQALERARLHEATQAARREAEQASRAKDEFLAMLGHELRNPLSPILTAVQLMRVRGDQTSVREQSVIERQVTHLIHLVDDLLDISRITRGKVQLDKHPHMLASLVTKAVEIASPLCEENRHHVTVDIPVETIWLEADETRLCQVFTNLVTNAAKYTPRGGRIDIRAKRNGQHVRISVKDNGVGITPELLPKVFDLFVQGERRTHRSQGGLGIGLAIVKNLVTLHGGTVKVISDGVNRGSEFIVELPVVDMQAKPNLERSVRQGVQVTPRKILVVDDNEDAGSLLGEMLSSLGHEVVVALDGPRALEVLERFTPEIGILDIGLPVMDGYELASALRTRLGGGLRLMAVTGYGQEQDKQRTQQAGFEAHFVKPVGLGKVLAAIEVAAKQT